MLTDVDTSINIVSAAGTERRRALDGKRRAGNQKGDVDGLSESSVFCLPGGLGLQEALAGFVFGSG